MKDLWDLTDVDNKGGCSTKKRWGSRRRRVLEFLSFNSRLITFVVKRLAVARVSWLTGRVGVCSRTKGFGVGTQGILSADTSPWGSVAGRTRAAKVAEEGACTRAATPRATQELPETRGGGHHGSKGAQGKQEGPRGGGGGGGGHGGGGSRQGAGNNAQGGRG